MNDTLQNRLNAFNAHLDATYPEHAGNPIRPPYIEAAQWPIRRADFGIDDQRPWDADEKLTIIVQPWADMQVRDLAKLFWNGKPVSTKALLEEQLGKRLVFKVNGDKVPEGLGALVLNVERSAGPSELYKAVYTSAALSTVAWFDCPGDQDEVAEIDAQGEERFFVPCILAAPTVQTPDDGVIRSLQTSQVVPVTVAPYRYMSPFDTIRLYWGSQAIERLVQENEVGQAVVIEVDKTTIDAAGDGDPLALSYEVIDEVGNASRSRSEQASIKVQLGSQPRPARPASVETVAAPELSGRSSQAQQIKADVPRVKDAALDDGLLTVSPDLAELMVTVGLSAGLVPGDMVYVTLDCMRANGREWDDLSDDTIVVDPPTDQVFRFAGAKYVKPFEGGWVEISYTIERGKPVVERTSEKVRVYVGDVLENLPPAQTAPSLEDDNLDPNLQAFKDGIDITIPALPDIKPPYRVELFWDTSSGRYREIEQAVAAGNRPEPFHIPHSDLAVEGAPLVYATVYYMIYQDGKPDRASEDFEFTISEEQEAEELADYLDDQSAAANEAEALLRDFDTYLKSKYPDAPPTVIPSPYLYGALHPAGAVDFGVGAQLLEDYDDQVLVLIPAWESMKAGDVVQLYWEERLVAFGKVRITQVGQFMTLAVDSSDVPSARGSLYCQVRRKAGDIERSAAVSTQVLLDPPGVEGVLGVGQQLTRPVVAPQSGVIGQAEARGKVRVTIAPYLNMNPRNVIHLFWGDQSIERALTEQDVNQPVVIEVDEQAISNAGDSLALPVYYYVSDEVGNESEWSEDSIVSVNLLEGRLLSPQVLDQGGMVNETHTIDRSMSGAAPLSIQVHDPALLPGDDVVLNWVGTTDSGLVVDRVFGSVQLREAGELLKFSVPSEQWQALSRAKCAYTVTRSEISSRSGLAHVHFTAAPSRLPAPTLKDDESGWIDANLATLIARVPLEAGLQKDDIVTLKVVGTASDATVRLKLAPRRHITALWVGKVVPFSLKGADHLKPFDGGYIDVSYTVQRGNQTLSSEVARWDVGYLAESLPAPSPEQSLPQGALDPSLGIYARGMGIVLPSDIESLAPCKATLYWSGSDGTYHEQEVTIGVGEKAPVVEVPRKAFDLDEGVEVEAHYVLEFDDKPARASADLVFRIAKGKGQSELLPALVIAGTDGGKLSVADIPAGGLQVRVPEYPGMSEGDRIVIKFGDYSHAPYVVKQKGTQLITLPRGAVFGGASGSASVSYEVLRPGVAEPIASQGLLLECERIELWEDFETITRLVLRAGQSVRVPTMTLRVIVPNLQFTNNRWIPDKTMVFAVNGVTGPNPAYVMLLDTPVRAVRLRVGGYGSIRVLDARGRELAASLRTHHGKDNQVTLSAGAGQLIHQIEIAASKKPGYLSIGVASVQMIR
ncbi:hypothetical protein [Pseudomonas sichuanensis]|uniref:hypothetical protein n=1 Tax=Pseudomonas sichuanensis TaxID=2213015 RepID=UPI000DA6AB7F|nr:hypothetical protein [Pseudomonas sichuanensis]